MAVKTLTTPKQVQGAGAAWLDVPGRYHFAITDVDESPKKKSGELIDGTRYQIKVMEGPQKDRQFDLLLFNPNPVKDGDSEWPQRKISAMLIATGMMTEQQLGGDVSYDPQDMRVRQGVIDLSKDEHNSTAEKSFLQLSYANIFHIDDPRVADAPKNGDALKLLPASQRREPKSFDLEKLTGKKASDHAATNGAAASSHKQVNVDDL